MQEIVEHAYCRLKAPASLLRWPRVVLFPCGVDKHKQSCICVPVQLGDREVFENDSTNYMYIFLETAFFIYLFLVHHFSQNNGPGT